MFPPEVVDLSVKLLIPDVCVGRIIGRSGERVQSLRASSGAHIWCTPKPAPETPAAPERPLHINGKLHQVIAAVFGVMDALHAEPASVVYTHASVVYALPQAAPSAASAPPSFPGSSASIGSPLSSVSSAPGLFDANPSRFGQAARRASRPPALSGGSSCPSSPVPDEATDSTASVQSASSTSEKILASTLAARSRTPSRASSSSVDAVDSPAAGDLATKWASPRRLRKRAPLSPSYLMPASPHGFAYMYPPGPMMSPQFAPWMFAQQPFHWLPSTPAPAAHPCPISACPRCESACQCISDTFTIPEAVAGVVLGKGGSTLRWMQVHTSCSILLSARGDPCFGASGTRYVYLFSHDCAGLT